MKVTGEQCREAVVSSGKVWWRSHDCIICGVDVGWIFDGDAVRYRSQCGCGILSPDQPRTWGDVAHAINIQTKPEIAQMMFSELSQP